jgi:hypothetical protein
MLGLFLFIVFFTTICWSINQPKQEKNLEITQISQKETSNKTRERRHNTIEPLSSPGIIYLPEFKPSALIESCSSATTNNEIKPVEKSNRNVVLESCNSDYEEPEIVTSNLYQRKIENLQNDSFSNSTSSNYSTSNLEEDATYAVGGAIAGAGVAATVGGMGLAVGGTAVGIGAAPVVVAGAIAGLAVSGAKKAIDEGDATAIGAVAGGAAIGAGVSTVVGGMGLAVGGTAVAIGIAPVAAVGAAIGLAAYGLSKLIGSNR